MNPAHFIRQRKHVAMARHQGTRKRRAAETTRAFSPATIIEIREQYRSGASSVEIARERHVAPFTILQIVRKRTYREIYGSASLDNKDRARTRGEKSRHAKLTNAQAVEIAELLQQRMSNVAIAQRFHVSPSTIQSIRGGDNWSHITGIVPKAQREAVLKHWRGGQQGA